MTYGFLVVYFILGGLTLASLSRKKMYVALTFYTAGFTVLSMLFGIYCLTEVLPPWAGTFIETVGEVQYMLYLIAVLVSIFTCLSAFFVVGTAIREHRQLCAETVKRLPKTEKPKQVSEEILSFGQRGYCRIFCRYNC